MKRIVTAIALGLLLVACGGNGPAALGPGPSVAPSPSPTISPSPSPQPSPSSTPGKPFTFAIWLTRDGKLFQTQRTEPFVPAVGQLALTDLLAGPTAKERSASVDTAIASGVTGRIAALAKGVATVQMNPTGVAWQELGVAQIVYTLTQYPTISSVVLNVAPGGRLTRATYANLLPPIVVESPVIGQTVQSPITVSGTADVFEAVVSIKVLDENGHVLVSTFTNASCGTGCRGDYSTSVKYSVGHQQPGTVEVYEVSAKDGSAINVQDIPVILMP